MATFRCPSCGTRARVDAATARAGARVTCSGCGAEFVVRGVTKKERRETVSGAETEVGAPPTPAPAPAKPVSAPPPASPLTPPEADETERIPRDLVPGHVILEPLGRGGMGAVYKARQLSLDRLVALKLLARRLSTVPDFVRRFEKEAKALAALAHPNVTAIYDRGVAGGHCYFTMEYVDGTTLAGRQASGLLPLGEAGRIFCDVCSAIAYSHARGIIHRDLKPGNVLIAADGTVKVTDFGLAGMLGPDRDGSSITKTNMVMGTVNYMPPEQRRDAKSVDERADVYSLGVMLYELLTGQLPLGRFEAPSRLRPDVVSPRFDEICGRALSFKPDDRHGTVDELRTEVVETLRSGLSAVATSSLDTLVGFRAGESAAPAASAVAGPSTLVASAPGAITHAGATVVQVPGTLPPQAVATVERAVGRLFLSALLLGALAVGAGFLLPPAWVPGPLRGVAGAVRGLVVPPEDPAVQRTREAVAEARPLVRAHDWEAAARALEAARPMAGEQRFEGLLTLAKALVEGATGGTGVNVDALTTASRALDELGDPLEAGRRDPEYVYYRLRTLRLGGDLVRAEALLESFDGAALVGPAALPEAALILSRSGRRSEAVSRLATAAVTLRPSAVRDLGPLCYGRFRELEREDAGPDAGWSDLARLCWVLRRASPEGERSWAVLGSMASSRAATSPGAALEALERGDRGDAPADEQGGVVYCRLLAELGRLREEAGRPRDAVAAYRKYRAVILSGVTPPGGKDKLSPELGRLLVETRENPGEGVELLQAAGGPTGALFDGDRAGVLALALAEGRLLAAVDEGTDAVAPEPATTAVAAALVDVVRTLERVTGPSVTPAGRVRAAAVRARAEGLRGRFGEAAAAWEAVLEDGAASREQADLARLMLVRLICDVPSLRARVDRVEALMAAVSDAAADRSPRAYWYARLVTLWRSAGGGLAAGGSSAVVDALGRLRRLGGGEDGGAPVAASVVDLAGAPDGASAEAALSRLRAAMGPPWWWAFEAALVVAGRSVDRAEATADASSRLALLAEADRCLGGLERLPSGLIPPAVAGLRRRVTVARSLLRGVEEMSADELQAAVALESEPRRLATLRLALARRRAQAGGVDEALALVALCAPTVPVDAALARAAILSAAPGRSVDETAAALVDAIVLGLGEGRSVDGAVDSLVATLTPLPASAAGAWWARLLDKVPTFEAALRRLGERCGDDEPALVATLFEVAADRSGGRAGLDRDAAGWRLRAAGAAARDGNRAEALAGFARGLERLVRVRDGLPPTGLEAADAALLEGRTRWAMARLGQAATQTGPAASALRSAVAAVEGREDADGARVRCAAALALLDIYDETGASELARRCAVDALAAAEVLLADGGPTAGVSGRELRARWAALADRVARDLAAAGRRDEALAVAERAVAAAGPGEAGPRVLLGEVALPGGDGVAPACSPEAARRLVPVLEAAVAVDPAGGRARTLLAEAALRAGDPVRALAVTEGAAALTTGRDEGRRRFVEGLAASALGLGDRAREALAAAERASERPWLARLALAHLARREGRSDELRSCVAVLAAVASPNDWQRAQTADLALLAGEAEVAERVIGVVSPGTSPELTLRRGQALMALGRADEAVRALELSLEGCSEGRGPSRALVLRFLGEALASSGQTARAVAALQSAADRDPSDARTWYWLARLALEDDDGPAAASRAARAAALAPRDPAPALILAATAVASGDPVAATTAVARLGELAPDHPETSFLTGLAAGLRGDRGARRRGLERARTLAPDWAPPLEELGFDRLLAADPAGAEALFETARDPSGRLTPRAALGLGQARAAQGRARAALVPLMTAALEPSLRAVAARELGRVLDGLGAAAAAEAWRREAERGRVGSTAATGATTAVAGP